MCKETTKKNIRHASGWAFGLLAIVTGGMLFHYVTTMQEAWSSDSKMAKSLVSALKVTRTGIIQVDNQMRITGWNEAMQNLTGLSLSEVANHQLSEYMGDANAHYHDDKASKSMAASKAGGSHQVITLPCVLIGKGGKLVTVHVRAYIVPNKMIGIALVDEQATLLPPE